MQLTRFAPIVLPISAVVIISLAVPAAILLVETHHLKTLIFILGIIFAIVTGGLLHWILREQQILANSQKRFEDMGNSTPNIICELDNKFKIRYANPVAMKVFGFSQEKLDYGIEIPQLFFKNERFAARKLLAKSLTSDEPQTGVFEVQKTDGATFPCEMTLAPSFDIFGQRIGFRCIMRDMSALQEAEQYIEHLTLIDKLTGLPNQLLFEDRLASAIAKARRTKESVMLFLAEIVHFKLIAESQGHAIADAILSAVSERLASHFREEDTLAFTNNEEFALVVCQSAYQDKMQSGLTVAKKMLDNLQKPYILNGREMFLGTNIGIAIYPTDAEKADELIKKAEAAKYHARAQGKNNYQFYQPTLTQIAHKHQETEKRLRYALKNEEFQLFYQSIFKQNNSRPWSIALLPYWHNPEQGLLPPAAFLPLLEENNLLPYLAEWMLKQTLPPDCSLMMPFSVRYLSNPRLMQQLKEMMDSKSLPLMFEIDSKLLANKHQDTHPTLTWFLENSKFFLKENDPANALLLFKQYPPLAGLKVDAHSLIEQYASHQEWFNTWHTFTDFLKVSMIVEEVNSEKLYQFCLKNGFDLLQGDYLSKPVPAKELVQK